MGADLTFPAMGSSARVVVVGGDRRLAERARRRIEELEARWSRFLPTSEVSRVNVAAGTPAVVSEDTFLLFELACRGWRESGGRFDPTVGAAVARLGYETTFALVRDDGPVAGRAAPAPGCGGIRLDPVVRAVTIPRGVHFDPGGIGKGLAADLVATELLTGGAAGALVSLGGDLRVAGEPPAGRATWDVVVEDPFRPDVAVATLAVRDVGVATTARTRRVWRRGGVPVHHLVDPATGEPAAGPLAVTAVASEAWRAEVAAKAIAVGGAPEGGPAGATEVSGVVVHAGGRVEAFGSAA